MKKTMLIGTFIVVSLLLMSIGVFAVETNSNQGSGTNSQMCKGIEYNGKCYNGESSLVVKENDLLYTQERILRIISITGNYCTNENGELTCTELLPVITLEKAKRNIPDVCPNGDCPIPERGQFQIFQGEEAEVDEGIYLKLEGTNVNSNPKTATFEIIFGGEARNCPVGCVCNKEETTCPTEQESITTTIKIPTENGGGTTNSEDESANKATNSKEETISITPSETGSGSVIDYKGIKVKAESTTVVDSELYINETKVKVMPDTASETAIEKLGELNFTIELKDTGKYHIQAEKEARLFFVVPVKEKVSIDIDAENGNIISESGSWWGFLAKNVE